MAATTFGLKANKGGARLALHAEELYGAHWNVWHVVNYSCCNLIGTAKFLPMAQECLSYFTTPFSSRRGGVSQPAVDPEVRSVQGEIVDEGDAIPGASQKGLVHVHRQLSCPPDRPGHSRVSSAPHPRSCHPWWLHLH